MTIDNDNLLETDFRALLLGALTQASRVTEAGCPIYLCSSEAEGVAFRQCLSNGGWSHRQTICWVKNSMIMGRQDYQWQHEPILYGWKPGAAHRWYGGFDKKTLRDDEPTLKELDKKQLMAEITRLRNERKSDVVRCDKPQVSDLHPTMKPTALIAEHIQNSDRRGDNVLDPFAGSG